MCTRTSKGVDGRACKREFKSNKKKRFKKEKHTKGVRACMDGVGMRVCVHKPARVRGACLRASRRGCVCMHKYVHECAGVRVCGRVGMCA